ncbi:MAG TPA: molybdopterin-dependent oxidoreductase [Gemmatimonadaceae bacterium]|nr:molybdopterin-dependent oxidoreductase [Gemmatimonadaceae bacterium]
MSTVDRRTFLRDVAVATAAVAVLPTTAAAADGGTGAAQPGLVWRKAPCRLCGVGCGLLVGIQNGRAVAVKGDPDSPVSRGMACVKGYHAVQALYGRDRITRALVRRQGVLAPVPLNEALDHVARTLRETLERHGPRSVGLYGSAQWSVTDAYIAAKLFRGALGTANVDTSARLYGASAAAGLRTTFGLDGAVGCYEDIEHADTFVIWNSNIAETDPVLFSRMLARRREDPAVRIIDLATRTTRTSYGADQALLYRPQAELAIANAIAHEIVARGWVNQDFVDRHVAFKRGTVGIGYTPGDAPPAGEDGTDASWDECVRFLAAYTPEHAQQLSGTPAERIRWLASLYGDPGRRVLSIWGAGLNQHTRGTWINNLLYNLHLLVGKIASAGNGPLGLPEQPCGGAAVHDAGAVSGALPHGSTTSEADRRFAAGIWNVPLQRIAAGTSPTAIPLFRALDQGELRFLWVQATNPMVSLPNLDRYRGAAIRDGRFLVVSEAYPTATTDVADVVLPAAMWIEREGIYANAERRLQHFEQMVRPPGDAMSDAAQMMEVARRLGHASHFPWDPARHVEQAWNEYRRFHDTPQRSLASIDELRSRPGVIWPWVAGRETRWRYNTKEDPAADPAHGDFDFYGHPDHRAWFWLRPYEPAAEAPDRSYPFWLTTGRVLEHWGAGSMTRRIPTLHRAVPRAYVEMNASDARELGIQRGEVVRLVSRRGSLELEARIDHRSQPQRGQVFVPSFDEARPVNRLTLDAGCPISGQPDYGKCAVRVERLTRGSPP